LIWLILAVGGFALPWQQMLVGIATPPERHELSTDPAKRESQLRAAVSRLDGLGNVLPYGRGSLYVELAAIEAERGLHPEAARLLRRGLQFGPQPLETRLALVQQTVLAGADDRRALAAANLHDIARFAEPHEAGQIADAARRLGLPQPWTEYVEPKVKLDKPVSILALGAIPPRTVESVVRRLEQTLQASVVVTNDPGFQPTTKNRLSGRSLQFDADDVAKNVAAEHFGALDGRRFAARLIFVDFDIYAFGLNFIYATATKDGSSLISIRRFEDENVDLARERATKQALTSLLDQLGQERPSHSSCVNANSAGRASFDGKSEVICSETLLAIARRQTAASGATGREQAEARR
jgi:predicted Zn-dependent protease